MREIINLDPLLQLAAILLIAISFVPFFRRPVLQFAQMSEREVGLSFWDKIAIFLLFALAVIFTILAAFATGLLMLIFLLLAGFFTLLATFWWLFEFMIWPWESEFWQIFFQHPWLAFFLGLMVLLPLTVFVILGLVALGVLGGLTAAALLIPILILVALWWLIFVWRCGWIVWLQSKLVPFVVWFWKTLRFLFEFTVTVSKAVHRYFKELREEWRQIRVRKCASWRWWLRWICTGFTYVMQLVLVVVEVIVHVIVWIVMTIVMLLWLVVTILVSIVVLVPLLVIKLLFWCW